MPISLKIKYFNTFILRQEPIVTTAVVANATNDGVAAPNTALAASTSVELTASNSAILPDMLIHGPGIEETTTITGVAGTTLTINPARKIEKGVTLTISRATAYPVDSSGVPEDLAANKEWHVEESRIKGGFNEKTVDFGAKAYLVDKKYDRNHRKNAMIYSGIFNSRTSVNDTNQFSIGENITKAVDSAYGSIQKLYAEDTNMLIFQENKVHNALIDKDAIFTAEGASISTSGKIVIGQIQPYLGEFGIGTDPESFAVYGFRKYFVDRDRSAVLRLSRDGITEISSYGMKSFFRKHLKISNSVLGMYDMHTKSYVLSLGLTSDVNQNKQTHVSKITSTTSESSREKVIKIKKADINIVPGMRVKSNNTGNKIILVTNAVDATGLAATDITISANLIVAANETIEFIPDTQFGINVLQPKTRFKTLTFDDKVNGWTSFFTYKPAFGGSIASNFYTWNGADLYKHYDNTQKNTFYSVFQPSTVTIISNQNPSLVKHYKTVNYEGTNNWKVIDFRSPAEDAVDYEAYPIPGNITGRYSQEGAVKFAGFVPLEKKYYANVIIKDNSTVTGISALKSTGVKGFFAETTLEHEPVDNNKKSNKSKHAELFSVGFNYEQSLY
jgi:hypothetical protein